MFNSVLVVCLGNICRSPVLEGMLKHYFQENGFDNKVSSAGITAMVGDGASRNSITVANARGMDITGHRARQITADMIREHDLIFVMEDHQQSTLEQQFPFSRGKVQTIGRFRNRQIADPYRQPLDAFERMADNLEEGLSDWTDKFWAKKNETTV